MVIETSTSGVYEVVMGKHLGLPRVGYITALPDGSVEIAFEGSRIYVALGDVPGFVEALEAAAEA